MGHAVIRSKILWAALGITSASACAQIISADFSDLRPLEPEGTAGLGGSGAGMGGDDNDADPGTSGGGGESGNGGSSGMEAAAGSGSLEAGPDVMAEGAARPDVESDRPTPGDGSTDASKDQGASDGIADANHDAPQDGPVVDAALPGVVINELNGQGSIEDYIELYNGSAASFDLSQYSVAQGSGIAGPPDPTSLLTFPNGTTLNPGQFLVIVANQLPPNVRGGPHDPCNVPGFQSISCYYADWGISKNGERVYLLAPGGTPFEFVDFPVPGLNQPVSGRSYGRFPDGVGSFQSTSWTPGAANQL
jgi:hypothetical protein